MQNFSLVVTGAPQPDLEGSEAPRSARTMPSSWPRRRQGSGYGGRRAEGQEKQELEPHRCGAFLGSSINECKGGQGRAFWLDGENGDPEKGFMGNGLGLHGRGGARGLQGLVHQSQVSGWETPGWGQRAEIPGRVVNPRIAGRRQKGMILLPSLRLLSNLPPLLPATAPHPGNFSWQE